MAVDLSGLIYVTNLDGGALKKGSITKYLPGATGNAAPVAVISAPSTGVDQTGLGNPVGIAVDAAANIYVANHGGGPAGVGTVTEYKAGSNGNAAPIAAIIPGSGVTDNTQLVLPFGIALDPAGHIYVANFGGGLSLSFCASTPCGTVNKYKRGSTGNAAPIAVIGPTGFIPDDTGIRHPFGIAVGR